MTSQIDMIRILLVDPALTITSLRTQGEGITAEFANASMNTIAIAAASANNWIATRNQANFIAIAPDSPSPAGLLTDAILYHVADSVNQAAILSAGLKRGIGGNTVLNRSYAGRVHLAAHMRDAFQFVHFQINKSPPYTFGATQVSKFPKLFAELDIFSVHIGAGTTLYDDHHFDGRGVWLEQDIPTSQINLLKAEDWHPLFKEMYPDDQSFYARCQCV